MRSKAEIAAVQRQLMEVVAELKTTQKGYPSMVPVRAVAIGEANVLRWALGEPPITRAEHMFSAFAEECLRLEHLPKENEKMKPKTTAGKTVPCPTQHDCDLLDRTIDLLLVYVQYEGHDESRAAAYSSIKTLKQVAEGCNRLRMDQADAPQADSK